MKKLFCCIAGVLLGFSTVWAQEKQPVVLDSVVVTGTRIEQKTEKIPGKITVIDADEISKSGAQTVPDLLRNLAGVTVTDLNGNGFNQKVDMGGFGETSDRHVAIVVNGRKINPIDQSGVNFLSIPVENVEKIEVLHGGNSVLYGGDAMGGVINIITKEAKPGVHGHAEAGGGTMNTTKQTAGINFSKDGVSGNMGVAKFDTDGYRDRSEADRTSVYGKFRVDTSDLFSVSIEANHTNADYQYPGGLTKAQMEQDRKQATNPSDEGESRDNYYVLGVESDWGAFGRLDMNLSYRDYHREDDMVSWFSYWEYDYQTIGANPQYILDHDLFGNANRLTLGVEMYDTDYDSWYGFPKAFIKTNHFDHDQQTTGVYIQDEFNLAENLVLNAGARHEDFDTTLRSSLNQSEDISENEWAWNAGIAYIFKPDSKLYARAYQAFRFPRVDEFMSLSTGTVNSDLEHETSLGYEVGARFVGLNNKLQLDARLFTFDVDDEITWNDAAKQNENLEETRHQGAQFDASFLATDWFELFGGLAYTDAEQTAGPNDGKQIPLVPELKANAGVELSFDSGFTFRARYNYLDSRYAGSDNSNELDKLDSADTVDLYASYTYQQFELFVNATNIFNEEYYDGYKFGPSSESLFPMPEAVYYAGVKCRF